MTRPHEADRDDQFIKDMIEYAQKAINFCEGQQFEEFDGDHKTFFAVSYAIQTVGEASIKVSDEFKKKHPKLPWKMMRDMRNILVHAYHRADNEVVWNTVKNDLPQLVNLLEDLLE